MTLWAKWKIGAVAALALLALSAVIQAAGFMIRALGEILGSTMPDHAELIVNGTGALALIGLGPLLVFEFVKLTSPHLVRRLDVDG